MPNPRLAARYAKSLIDIAVEHNNLGAILDDMQLLESICFSNADFCSMLRSPIIKGDKKEAIIKAIVSGSLQQLTSAFVSLLTKKGREGDLPEIATAFIAQYKDMKRIRTVRLVTAAPVTDAVKESIRSKIAGDMPGENIELESAVDEDLIGGFMLEMNDKLIDASVRRDLMDLRKQFADKSYVYQVR